MSADEDELSESLPAENTEDAEKNNMNGKTKHKILQNAWLLRYNIVCNLAL